jgi:hypothetical protein
MMWTNVLEWGRARMTIRQQRIGKGSSTLRLTYIVSFVQYDVVLTDKFDLESQSFYGWNISSLSHVNLVWKINKKPPTPLQTLYINIDS